MKRLLPVVIAGSFLTVISLSCSRKVGFNNPFDPDVPLTNPAQLRLVAISDSSLMLSWQTYVRFSGTGQQNNASIFVQQSADGNIYRMIDTVSALADSTVIDEDLLPGQPYYFRIFERVGSKATGYSNAITAVLQTSSVPGPTNLRISSVSESARMLAWTPPASNVAGFILERKDGKTSTYVQIGKLSPNSTSFTDSSVIKTDTLYTYRLYAFSDRGTLSPFDTLNVTIPFPAPSSLSCYGRSSDHLTMVWENNFYAPVTSVVERSSDGVNFSPVGTTSLGVNSYTDNQVDRYRSYTYRVRSYSKYNESPYSAEMQADYQCNSMTRAGNPYVLGGFTTTGEWRYPRLMDVSRNGKVAFFWLQDGTVLTMNLTTGAMMHTFSGAAPITGICLSGDGQVISMADSADGSFYAYSTADGTLLKTIHVTAPAVDMQLSDDGTALITSSGDTVVRVWSVSDGSLVRSLYGHKSFPISLSLTNDGSTLVSGASDGIILWDWNTGSVLKSIPGSFFTRPISVLSSGEICKLVFPSQAIGQTQIMDISSGKIIESFPATGISGPDAPVYSGFISADGATAVTCENSFTVAYNSVANSIAYTANIGGQTMIARGGSDLTFVAGYFNGYGGPYVYIYNLGYGWTPTAK